MLLACEVWPPTVWGCFQGMFAQTPHPPTAAQTACWSNATVHGSLGVGVYNYRISWTIWWEEDGEFEQMSFPLSPPYAFT